MENTTPENPSPDTPVTSTTETGTKPSIATPTETLLSEASQPATETTDLVVIGTPVVIMSRADMDKLVGITPLTRMPNAENSVLVMPIAIPDSIAQGQADVILTHHARSVRMKNGKPKFHNKVCGSWRIRVAISQSSEKHVFLVQLPEKIENNLPKA